MGFVVVNDPYCVVQDCVEFREHFLARQHLAVKHTVSCLAFRRHFFQLGCKSRQPAHHRGSPVSTDPNTKQPVQSACSIFLQHWLFLSWWLSSEVKDKRVNLHAAHPDAHIGYTPTLLPYFLHQWIRPLVLPTTEMLLFCPAIVPQYPQQYHRFSQQQFCWKVEPFPPPQKFETDVFCSGQY